jgi:hypothetical protein
MNLTAEGAEYSFHFAPSAMNFWRDTVHRAKAVVRMRVVRLFWQGRSRFEIGDLIGRLALFTRSAFGLKEGLFVGPDSRRTPR